MDTNEILQKRTMYLTSLLGETLPLSLLTKEVLGEIGIVENENFSLIHILFDNKLKDAIESQDEDHVADWKATIHEAILLPLKREGIQSYHILNLSPYTRTIVFSYSDINREVLWQLIKDWYIEVKDYLHLNHSAKVLAFAHLQATPFTKIGKRYKEIRNLQNYQYTIGMNHLVFYEDFHTSDDYSVTEYKYIQRYENQLNDEDYGSIHKTIHDLYEFAHNHVIKDSKLTYIYKELMSITIRFLYVHETDNLQLINSLNNCINNFQKIFDDLSQVHQFMVELIEALMVKDPQTQTNHPHIRKTLKIIHRSYKQDLSLSDISSELGLSNAYLSRLFKENLQISFKDYLTKYRLNAIKDLLEKTSKPIGEIAGLAGYQNPDQMTRIFKKYEKMTPRQYRQQKTSSPM